MNQQPPSELFQELRPLDFKALRKRLARETSRPTEDLFATHYAQVIETVVNRGHIPANLNVRIKLDQTT